MYRLNIIFRLKDYTKNLKINFKNILDHSKGNLQMKWKPFNTTEMSIQYIKYSIY